MIECFEFITDDQNKATHSLLLTFEQRQKSRAQATTESGEKVGWFLERGHVLADGNLLVAKSGEMIRVIAANETLSEVHSHDVLAVMKTAYHLGNRHVPLQITEGYLHFQHDHVLDDMVRGLGLSVTCVEKPFHPESGAYHSHSSSENEREQEHKHSHEHPHSHA